MAEPLRVSFSRIKAWRRCHKAHWYKYMLGVQRKRVPSGMYKGRIVHEMVEAYLRGEKWEKVLAGYVKEYNKMFAEEREMYGDIPNDMRRIMEGYIRQWNKDGLKYIAIEKKFEFPIEKDLLFVFQIDAVVRDKKKREWLLERKTPKKFPDEQIRLSDIQTLLYTWALDQVGRGGLTGVLWDYVRSKPPTVPEVLKKGGLSVAQNIDTDYYTYMEAIKANKLNPKDYAVKLSDLETSSRDKFYRRVYMPVSETARGIVVNDLITTAREIKENPKSDTRTLDYTCRQCQYFNLCQAELRDLDVDFILKTEYVNTEDDTNESETEEE